MADPIPIKVPYTILSASTLNEVVQEFVTRDGTDHSKVEQRMQAVLKQLKDGIVELIYDSETASTNIVPLLK